MVRIALSYEQKKFLVSKVPEFREAQQNLATRAFFVVLYLAWFEKWPLADTGNDGSDSDGDARPEDELTPFQAMKQVSADFTFHLEENTTYAVSED